MTALIIFSTSFILFCYIYGGYRYILHFLVWLRRLVGSRPHSHAQEERSTPGVTVYFSALNEESNVTERLENLFSMEYQGTVEIVVVSDGSTDGTVRLVKEAIDANPSRDIRLIEFKSNRGPAAAQNEVAVAAKYDILLSTDAETRFSRDLLREMVKPFSDPRVGVVGGKVIYLPEGSAIGEAYGLYRSAEYDMRRSETELGIGFQVDGPCTAYRKEIWEPIKDYEDVDQVISLIARKKGFLTVQADEAVCYDRANSSRRKEIRQRARMTRKGLLSKLGRWGISDIVRHPFFSLALFSHKLVRYFTPVLLCIIFFSGAWLASVTGHGMETFALVCGVATLFFAGYYLNMPALRKISESLVSFVYANIGFAIGILQWIWGDRGGSYKPTGQL